MRKKQDTNRIAGRLETFLARKRQERSQLKLRIEHEISSLDQVELSNLKKRKLHLKDLIDRAERCLAIHAQPSATILPWTRPTSGPVPADREVRRFAAG